MSRIVKNNTNKQTKGKKTVLFWPTLKKISLENWPQQNKTTFIHSVSQCLKKIFIFHSHTIFFEILTAATVFDSIQSNQTKMIVNFLQYFFSVLFCFVDFHGSINDDNVNDRQQQKKEESNETDWTQTKLPTNKHNCHQNCHFPFGSKTIDDNNNNNKAMNWNEIFLEQRKLFCMVTIWISLWLSFFA